MQLTSNAVPFGSTYRIKYRLDSHGKNSYDRSAEIDNYAFRNGIDYKVKYNRNLDGQVTSASGVIKCEDYKDFEVENFLARKGIDFSKRTMCSRCGEERILSKFKMPEDLGEGYQMVMMDIEKFDELYKSQDCGNIRQCKEEYENGKAKLTHNMLKQDEITAPLLHICSYGQDEDSIIATNAGKNRASLLFNPTTRIPNDCLYFAMKDIQMTKMPVVVDDYTLIAGKELGIFE